MKRPKRKLLCLILSAFLFISLPLDVSAVFSDVTQTAIYSSALNRLVSLGILSGNEKGEFRPNDMLTREQFAKIIITAAGLEDTAAVLSDKTIFPDVNPSSWSSGYINAALDKGYITGMPDGKFHPKEGISFAQACTILVRALGYTDSDLSGQWPRNYIEKAKILGLTDGISLSSNEAVPRWVCAVMVDRLLDTYVKASSPSGASMTFMEAAGYIECIILGNHETYEGIGSSQIITDKGIYYNTSGIEFELGGRYYLSIDGENVVKASSKLNTTVEITVSNAAEDSITYVSENRIKNMVLPKGITYYYNGQKQDYSTLNTLMHKNTSIIFSYNKNKTGYEFAVIFDPAYSKPQVADKFTSASRKLGTISFEDDTVIVKGGELIDVSQIEINDVVYQVTDIWQRNKYILVVDNKVAGEITDVIPDRLSPKKLQIDNVDYEFSKNFNTSIITNSYGTFSPGSNVIALLGYDGKIVAVKYFGVEDNSNYAVVLDSYYTIKANTDGTRDAEYSAKLLFSDGMTAVYDVTDNAYEYKGKLVKYSFVDDDLISLERISYNYPGEVIINKYERMMGENYVADNVKIFNVIYNDQGQEAKAELLKWSDLPDGTIPGGKIWYTATGGPFEDINIIFTNDIFNERYKTAIVKSVKAMPAGRDDTFEYTFVVEGKEYKYTKYKEDLNIGNVYDVRLNSSGIESLTAYRNPDVKGTNVQAVDARRIKINDKIYFFSDSISVYIRDPERNITVGNLGDIDLSREYHQVGLYFDSNKKNENKVAMIVLWK